jgi:glycerophosphoryl diester phosphodiesterase
MPLPALIEKMLMQLADAVCDHRRYPVPKDNRLQACKIIAHRGAHDNRRTLENTLAAFDGAAAAGVWGLELDIRWTRDAVPVVFHDVDLNRLYGRKERIAACTLDELKTLVPDIPSLAEVVSRFGKTIHLMIEIKGQTWPAPGIQEQRLLAALDGLTAGQDYHWLALDPEILVPFSSTTPRARLAVASGRAEFHSRWVRENNWGGICGHYLLLNDAAVQAHHHLGQQVGTGYVGSRNCLFRELNRGVDWIFSNNAVDLQRSLQEGGRKS